MFDGNTFWVTTTILVPKPLKSYLTLSDLIPSYHALSRFIPFVR